MTYNVEISRQADADLRSIYEYNAFTLLSAENAISSLLYLLFIAAIYDAFLLFYFVFP